MPAKSFKRAAAAKPDTQTEKKRSPEQWTADAGRRRPGRPRQYDPDLVKRFSIDLPHETHRRLKTASFHQDKPMAEILRDLIDNHLVD